MRAILISFALALAALPARAQTAAPASAPLPAEAQDALKKGILAAQQQDYLLAIRYFQDARKLAPEAPEIYYNLGLAESKVPGRELRAMAWFGAYLAANPAAPNAAAVREEIDVLDVKNQSNLSNLIRTVQQSVAQFDSKDYYFNTVVNLWAQAGDIAEARKTVSLIERPDLKNAALIQIAEDQLMAGDVAAAQKTADLIQEPEPKAKLEIDIAEAQAQAANGAGAKETLVAAFQMASHIRDASLKTSAQTDIAGAQIMAGDVGAAKETLAAALDTTRLIQRSDDKVLALSRIAEQLVRVSDNAGARDIVASAIETATPIQDAEHREGAFMFILDAQLDLCDIAGAQKSVNQISNAEVKQSEIDRTAMIQKYHCPKGPQVEVWAPRQTQVAVSDWLYELDDDSSFKVWALNTQLFLAPADYLKALPQTDDPGKTIMSLAGVAFKMAGARTFIEKMLKQQAGT